jgi:hypothetical protein
MERDFEYMNYSDSERLAMLESRAAELERLLGRVTPEYAAADESTGQYPTILIGGTGQQSAAPWYVTGGPRGAGAAGYEEPGHAPADYPHPGAGGFSAAGPDEPDERTEVLLNRGRRNVPRRGRGRRALSHWRAIAIAVGAVTVGCFLLAVILPGGSASWPASVARVQEEITAACQNPNVVSEPSQVNFACAKATRQILWVFSLLTSANNPNFADTSNGRKGLEPITPAQGGDVAWSLNLHHPYNPASPTDSLEVAARAINDIIGGATLTSGNGAPVVQAGLESSAVNCARYTGSSALVTRQGFPAICALPVATPAGQAALVTDVFQQWMVGAPQQIAADAGVLFENFDNPGDARVQAILNSLQISRL